MEHQRQRAGSRNAQRTGSRRAVQHSSAVFNGRKLYRIGRARLCLKDAPERKHKVLGGDGIICGGSLSGGVGQAVFYGKGVGAAIRGDGPAFAQVGQDLAIGVFAHKAAVKILAGNDVWRGRRHLWVKVCGDGIHKPCKAGCTGASAAAGKGKQERSGKHRCGDTQELFQGNDLILWYLLGVRMDIKSTLLRQV